MQNRHTFPKVPVILDTAPDAPPTVALKRLLTPKATPSANSSGPCIAP